MRLAICLLILFPCSILQAQEFKVGDQVVATSRQKLKVSGKEVDGVFAGLVMRVGKINGKWLWVGQKQYGWLDKQHVIPFDDAIDFFTDKLRENPKSVAWRWARAEIWMAKSEFEIAIRDYTILVEEHPEYAEAYNNRGIVFQNMKKYDKAISDFSEAIRLRPETGIIYSNRGVARVLNKEYEQAIVDFNDAIRLEPKNSYAYRGRGAARIKLGSYEKGLADYDEAIRLNPTYYRAISDRAWFRATCPDAKYRDGRKAWDDALKACELTKYEEGYALDALAASYAESGDFPHAIKWQEKAIELIKDEDWKDKSINRLAVYKQGKPFREEIEKE